MSKPIPKTIKTVELELTSRQLSKLRKAWAECDCGEMRGMLAIQPLIAVAKRDPCIKISLLTPEFSQALNKFLQLKRFSVTL